MSPLSWVLSLLVLLAWPSKSEAWTAAAVRRWPLAARGLCNARPPSSVHLLSNTHLENDLVAIRPQHRKSGGVDGVPEASNEVANAPRLCVVRPDGGVHPLCYHEDDVETDLFVDPREAGKPWTDNAADEDVEGMYGEGWYGQRPVPSLGGGPGYGAEADEIWSVDEEVLERVREDGVLLPVLDVGIAHGEKARGGAF